jgi:twitching motility protein PilT
MTRRGRGSTWTGERTTTFPLPFRRWAALGQVFRQRGSLAAVIRVFKFGLPDPVSLAFRRACCPLAENKKVCADHRSAARQVHHSGVMIDRINRNRNCHIIPWRTPSSISTAQQGHRHQREISIDTPGY